MIKLLYISILLFWFMFSATAVSEADAAKTDKALVGKVEVILVAPEGLVRVDGTNPVADAFLEKYEPEFKIKVLAIYAEAAQWATFAEALNNGKPMPLPRVALICIPVKMPKKSFGLKKLLREHRKFAQWFSFAANTRPATLFISSLGNEKLEKILGIDIGFEVEHDEYTVKFAGGSSYLSIGTGLSFDIYGQTSNIYLTATSQAIEDKMIFLGYGDTTGSEEVIKSIQTRALNWRKTLVEAQSVSH